MSAEVTCEADSSAKEFKAVGTGEGGSRIGLGGAAFSCLRCLSCRRPAFFHNSGCLV